GARAARLLDTILRTGERPAKAFATLDFLTGLPSQSSFIEPCKGLYALLEDLERSSGAMLTFMPGFPMADFDECGMSVFGYGASQGAVEKAVAQLRGAVADAEKDFAMELHTPDEAVKRAKARGAPGKPVVIADTQDNP